MSSDPLIDALVSTRKYRDVAPDVLAAALAYARPRAQGQAEVLKLAKRKLHQWFGAFTDAADRKAILGHLAEAAADAPHWRAHLAQAQARHASTRERQGEVVALWQGLLGLIEPPGSVLDLGCGLWPLTLPDSGLPPEVRYHGIDVDVGLCDAVAKALAVGFVHVTMQAADVRTAALPSADVALLLKLVPTLDQAARGAGRGLLERLDVRAVAVSFPRTTLSGRDVGMDTRNEATAAAVLDGLFKVVGRLRLTREDVFVARR